MIDQQPAVLGDLVAEEAIFSCILAEQGTIENLRTRKKQPNDVEYEMQNAHLYYDHHRVLHQAMRDLWEGFAPLDIPMIAKELEIKKKLSDALPPELRPNPKDFTPVKPILIAYLERLKAANINPDHVGHYVGIVIDYAIRRDAARKFAEGLKAVYALKPLDEIQAILQESSMILAGAKKDAVVLWKDSLEGYKKKLDERARRAKLPPEQRKLFDFPYPIWNQYIDPLTPGTGVLIAAPPNTGKSIFLEDIAEHWARHGQKVVFFQFELDEDDMDDRRNARWSGIHRRDVQGDMSPSARAHIDVTLDTLAAWSGGVNYIYCPGWTAEELIRSAKGLIDSGECHAIVIDYFQKIRGSDLLWKRFREQNKVEAEIMEIIKSFCQREGVPYIAASQMTKDAHSLQIEEITNKTIRGAGELSEKANISLVALPEVINGEYTSRVAVKITKNKGPKLFFYQKMIGPLYTMKEFS